jgi:hypothetical protein
LNLINTFADRILHLVLLVLRMIIVCDSRYWKRSSALRSGWRFQSPIVIPTTEYSVSFKLSIRRNDDDGSGRGPIATEQIHRYA